MMTKIDTSGWKEFRIGDLFDTYLSKDDIQPKNTVKGNIPLISSGKTNNGIVDYIDDVKAKIWNANTITVDMFGKTFYQNNSYHCVSHGRVNILVAKFNITEYVGLFLCPVIEQVSIKYKYDNMCTGEKLSNDIIKLPITSSGEPDWDYMESYMKAVMDESEKNIANLKKIDDTKQSIDVNGWGEFRVGDLLNMEKQIELSPIDAFNNNTQNEIMYPFYGQSSENNGIIDYYYLGEDLLNNINSEHCIMIHSNTHLAYYVNTPFYLKDGHGATTIFTNEHLTESSTFFIITVLNKTMFDKFDYDTKATKEKLENLIIKLPITSSGEPDWDYMESYMKAVMDESENNLAILKTL